jgi:ssDNA-binding Zn-finger/Zn-ribbon topoisomerase 1
VNCPKCGSSMVVRTAHSGSHVGQQFYGCSRYPKCTEIVPLSEAYSVSHSAAVAEKRQRAYRRTRPTAKRRRREPNTPVTITENVVVTKAVQKRLKKRAEAETPRSMAVLVGKIVTWTILPLFWVSGYFVTTALTHDWTWQRWLLILGFYLYLPLFSLWPLDWILEKPRKQRMAKVNSRFLELAEERKKLIAETARFYQSPEWAALRRQVLEDEGRVCAECGKKIVDDADVTIDHKHPRSKHPHLSLRRENLRVLCRRCNSRKGANDWLEV